MKGIKIGDKISKYPIIQGGMGVGVSMHKLAGAVAKAGGIGIISTADIGYKWVFHSPSLPDAAAAGPHPGLAP